MIENNLKLIHLRDECQICNGRGKTEIYREDLEEFEEVECLCLTQY